MTARHNRSLGVQQGRDPALRQVLLHQQTIESLGRNTHIEHMSHLAVRPDRHLHGNERTPRHPTEVEIGNSRPAGLDSPVDHVGMPRHGQRSTEGEQGIDDLLARCIRQDNGLPHTFRGQYLPGPGIKHL